MCVPYSAHFAEDSFQINLERLNYYKNSIPQNMQQFTNATKGPFKQPMKLLFGCFVLFAGGTIFAASEAPRITCNG